MERSSVHPRNGEIELLRFVFSLVVVAVHFDFWWIQLGIAMEFFFLLSGFFLAKTLSTEKEAHRQEPFRLTCRCSAAYLKSRIWKLFPSFALSTLIGAAVTLCASPPGNYGFLVLSDFLFLQNFGFPVASVTGVLWFLCALYFALWALYPLIRRYYDVFVPYFAPMLFLLISGFLLREYGSLSVPNSNYGLLNTGLLRGIAGLSLGAFVYEKHSSIKRLAQSRRWFRFLCTVAELGIWALILLKNLDRTANTSLDGILTIIMAVGVAISMSGASFTTEMLNNRVTRALGKFSAVLFMNHMYWAICLGAILSSVGLEADEDTVKYIGVGLSFFTSGFVLAVSIPLKRLLESIRQKLCASS